MFEHLRKPDYERLITTLRGGQADAAPLIELGIHPQIKGKILGRPVANVEDDIEFMRSMGYDFVKIQPKINFTLQFRDSESGSTAGDDRAWAAETTGVITNREEFEAYQWPKIEDIDYSAFEAAAKALPDDMTIIGQYGDIYTVVWEMMGFETFAMALYTDPELVQMLFDKVGSLILSMYEQMAEIDRIGAMWFSDDIAYTGGLLINPEFYDQYFFPWLKKIGDYAKKKDVPFIYHSDGVLFDVMERIIDSGVNAIHPIEPKSMDIKEVKERYGGRLAICGGVDVDVLSRGTPERIREITEDFLGSVARGGGWCAGSSNSIPDYAKVENYIAMVETVLTKGSY